MRWMVSGAAYDGTRKVVVSGADSTENAVQFVLPRLTERYGNVRLNLDDIRPSRHIFTMEIIKMFNDNSNVGSTLPQPPVPRVAHATVPAIDPAIAVQKAQEALAEAEAALAAKIERDEFERRINAEMELANVTHTLLRDIRDSSKIGRIPDTRCDFAKFRKELQPLADSYGYKIVLVGDKSQATLVKV